LTKVDFDIKGEEYWSLSWMVNYKRITLNLKAMIANNNNSEQPQSNDKYAKKFKK